MTVLSVSFPAPPFSAEEALKYAAPGDTALLPLLRECYEEIREELRYDVCYTFLPVSYAEDTVRFPSFSVASSALCQNFADAAEAVLFAATVGIAPDRAVRRASVRSSVRALCFQAIGAERIEALCDIFCRTLGEKYQTRPRFSPGYGGVSLDVQREFFQLLDCERRIGLTCNESLLMSPTKSVTAFVAVKPKP